jgi:hypothetical protein
VKPYKDIPIERAREIAETFDKDQVIIVTWDKAHGRTHVTTFGKTVDECEQAAQGGNRVKQALGWPEELCNTSPFVDSMCHKDGSRCGDRSKCRRAHLYTRR